MAVSLELAVTAIRSGRKDEGRQLLNLLIQQNPNNEMAWLWMSSVVNTDEQRARCLYHVLAINPDSKLARRGLNVLGIVVSDSRPVKVPRDSQPIPIPKPSSHPPSITDLPSKPVKPVDKAKTAAEPSPPAQPVSSERRPFLIDPNQVKADLPFKPLTTSEEEKVQASPAVLSLDVEEGPVASETEVQSAQPHSAEAAPAPQADQEKLATQPLEQEAPTAAPSPAVDREAFAPQPPQPVSEPGPANGQQPSPPQPDWSGQQPAFNSAGPWPGQTPTQADTNPVMPHQTPSPPQPQGWSGPQSTGSSQAPYGGSGGPHETRPSQPVPVSYPPMNMGWGQGSSQPYYPSPQMPGPHAQVTMGMPFPYQQQPSQPMPAPHSQATMGMPMQGSHAQHPSEPVSPVHSNSTMMMPAYGQMTSAGPPPGSVHSSVTMNMPAMTEAEARARLAGAYPQTNQDDQVDEDEGDGEEVNILAVIIFGTLSVTALGGLGMLILLMFAMPG